MNLCERFHCLPTDLYKQPAHFIQMIRMVDKEREVHPPDGE